MEVRVPQTKKKKKRKPTKADTSETCSPNRSISALQGSARVIKDNCADWSNYIDKWNGLNSDGLKIANEVINLKLKSHDKEIQNEHLQAHQFGEDGEKSTPENLYPEGLEGLCNKLTELCDSMELVFEKMMAITKRFRGVIELEKYNSIEGDLASPLFHGWPVEQFYKSSKELEDIYRMELKLKRFIVEDIAHKHDRDVLMMYMTSWLHQPYVEDRAALILESMLIETGHR